MVELGEKGNVNTEIIPLKPLREVKVVKGSLEEVLMETSDDYVTVILTDEETKDVDSVDRIRSKFPNLLEIRKEAVKREEVEKLKEISYELSEIENCRIFLNDIDDEEEKLLIDIINELKGV